MTHRLLLIGTALFLSLQACGLSSKEESAINIYKQNSRAYYNNGKYGEAIDQCIKGMEIDASDFDLNLTLAWSLLKAGGVPNTFAALDQFNKTDDLLWMEDDYRITLGLGETCYRIATVYRNRLERFGEQIKEDPAEEELYVEEIEECQDGQEEYLAMAIDYLLEVLDHERQEDNQEAILTLGQAYAYAGETEEAVRYLIKGLDVLQSSTSFLQARLDKDQGIDSDSRRFFERQITRNLRVEKELRGILAYVYEMDGEHAKALEQLNLLEERDLFENAQYYNRGMVLQNMGRYQEAIENFELFLSRGSVMGKGFDEDDRFHLAFERIEVCRKALGQPSSPVDTAESGGSAKE